jgi:XTP/dITP diphosphohydrolase
MKIVLATHNADKRAEIMKGFKPFNVQILSLNDFPEIGGIIEDGETLLENAFIKARTVNEITGLPTIADDTGLEVEVLNGQPGVYSARFAGEDCSYLDNVNKLIKEMKKVPNNKRSAVFKTCMVFVDNNMELSADGVVEGYITEEPKGNDGFGYDPVFYVKERRKTFAEMTIEEKNIISHRGKAIRNLCALLESKIGLTIKEEDA